MQSISEIKLLILLIFVIAANPSSQAWNLCNISNADGMTNSAALSLCQDYDGLLWIGTCEGINIFDGVHVYPFNQIFPDAKISGNIIEQITRTHHGEIWVQTNHGLNRVDTQKGKVTVFDNFHGHELLSKNNRNDLFILDEYGEMHVYDPGSDSFITIDNFKTNRDNVINIAFVANRMLMFTHDGITSTTLKACGNTY